MEVRGQDGIGVDLKTVSSDGTGHEGQEVPHVAFRPEESSVPVTAIRHVVQGTRVVRA
jgi:hypothetical protein